MFSQEGYQLRLEWGPEGVSALAECDVLIIVDVLSFTTSVDLVVARGGQVRPAGWQPGDRTLRPASLVNAGGLVELPSPNGSHLCTLAAETGRHVLAGCLRNAQAVAHKAMELGRTIAVIPAGERWPEGPLRPSVEDFLGAGAILDALHGTPSPEARLAADAYRFTDVRAAVFGCVSGRELIGQGHAADVDLALEINVSKTAPMLVDGVLR